jgi:uncharacterized membrane protein YedE/YeeE
MEPFLPWYIAGPLIGLIVPALLFLREQQFGMSSSFSFILSKALPRNDYFKSAGPKSAWQFHFGLGLIIAAVLALFFIDPVDLIIPDLAPKGDFLVEQVYSNENIFIFFLGGLLVGFGARYANGCTAGNCIMGVSQFSVSSIIATVSFFVSGVITAQFINPFIFH